MVHKSSIIPGLSQFLDSTVLSHYPPTSMKRIIAAGAIALFLKNNTSIVDQIINNEMFSSLGVSNKDGMLDIDTLKDVFKDEIKKAGFARISFPILGNVDFTYDDIDILYKSILAADSSSQSNLDIRRNTFNET